MKIDNRRGIEPYYGGYIGSNDSIFKSPFFCILRPPLNGSSNKVIPDDYSSFKCPCLV